jgi:CheY-like chemotaxis protein
MLAPYLWVRTLTKGKDDLPLDAVLPRGSAATSRPTALCEISRSIEAAEAGSEQHNLAQAWLNEEDAAGSPEVINPLRILVVEDDALIATLLAETLEMMGHEVCAIASTEKGAVTAAGLHRPDLLLVDSQLAQGSGFSAVEQIVLNGFVPHIFMSGDVLNPERLDPRAIALQKPFQDEDLARAIQRAFAESQATNGRLR